MHMVRNNATQNLQAQRTILQIHADTADDEAAKEQKSILPGQSVTSELSSAKATLGRELAAATTRLRARLTTPPFTGMDITTRYIPQCRVVRYLGQINLHFIRESWTLREGEGVSAFYHELMLRAQSMPGACSRPGGRLYRSGITRIWWQDIP